jgi:hypothetical protein
MSEEQEPYLRVECYAGYRADEEPRRFFIGDREVTVDALLDRWLDPEHRYFKVHGNDGGIYILRHDLNDDHWELTMYDSGQSGESHLSST